MSETLPLLIFGDTHEGLVHEKNEDSFAVVPTEDGGVVLIVCDGMGGMGKGDEASRIAVDVLTEELGKGTGFPPERMRRAVTAADVSVRNQLCGGDGLPGSTCVMVYVLEGLAHVCWVGDSRAYLIRGDRVVERTRDHKLVEELVAAGELTPEEARNSTLAHVVTRALGGRTPREPPVPAATINHPWALQNGDRVLVCSDGVCDLIMDDEVGPLIEDLPAEDGVAKIIETVLARGAHDNTTAILAIWDGPDVIDNEDNKETPVFAPPRAANPDEEDTGHGVIAWNDADEPLVDEEDDNITLVPSPDLQEILQQVRAAVPDDDPTSETSSPSNPAPALSEDEQGEGWKVALVMVLAGGLFIAAVFAINTLLSVAK